MFSVSRKVAAGSDTFGHGVNRLLFLRCAPKKFRAGRNQEASVPSYCHVQQVKTSGGTGGGSKALAKAWENGGAEKDGFCGIALGIYPRKR